ncbi:MAG: hypothetical protein JXP34_00790 [Planctomycetes bacterium]|nr:hypothetical protein [Planctomycetota bacterium]
MTREYDTPVAAPAPPCEDLRRSLARRIRESDLLQPHVFDRHEPGDLLRVEATGVAPATPVRVDLSLERFVGGGFAGQVYRARILRLIAEGPIPPGLEEGGVCAVKILRPPSRLKAMFRDALYWLAFQAPFSAQLLPAAARAGVLWQKLARRAADVRLGMPDAIVDPYATFFDEELRSFGELSEWVDGRVWHLEMDPHIRARRRVDVRDREMVERALGSREYLAKRGFMAMLVGLLHEIGAHELARQYEWWTAKSQPNVLKRHDADPGPWSGLVAIDFRAGLALLPFLPMSPADFRLIAAGLRRGSIVQFDRGDLGRLEGFVDAHAEQFADLRGALDELRETERAYRRGIPDVTRHWIRPLYDGRLARDVIAGSCEAWERKGTIDAERRSRLEASRVRFLVFFLAAFVPLLGPWIRRLWGNRRYARHVGACLASPRYLGRVLRVAQWSRLLVWHRTRRASTERASRLAGRGAGFWAERWTLGLLPVWLHRSLTDPRHAWRAIRSAVSFPFKLYFDPAYRSAWFLDQIRSGREEGMLTEEEERRLAASAIDPFIQTYLKACAVHVATLPVTQVVSLALALYVMLFQGRPWEEAIAWGVSILVAFQVIPISPGSFCRWLYVVYLVARDRRFRSYRVAFFVSLWKYIGYLGFPLQMVTTYPALSRFLACRWATRVVRIVPVFGERGALLEHGVFDLFFNVPVSIGRRRRERRAARSTAPSSPSTGPGSASTGPGSS